MYHHTTQASEANKMSVKFNRVAADGFVGAEGPLKQAGWSRYDAPAVGPSATALSLAHGLLFGGIKRVVEARRVVDRGALDAAWDTSQQRFTLSTILKGSDPDKKVASAAKRITDGLLWEGGALGQTQLTYEAEVDFGLLQIKLVEEDAALAQALRDAGLVSIFDEVRAATKAFEQGLGRAPDQRKALGPADMLRRAVREASASFELAYAIVSRLRANTPSGPDSDLLAALLTPLDELLARA